MYCHNCGYKIVPGRDKCGHCGHTAQAAEICGGFYGLAGTAVPDKALEAEKAMAAVKEPAADIKEAEKPVRKMPESEDGRQKKYEKKLLAQKKAAERKFTAAAVLCALLLVFSIAQSLRLGVRTKEFRSAEMDRTSFEEILDLKDQIAALDTEIALLTLEESRLLEDTEPAGQGTEKDQINIPWVDGGHAPQEDTSDAKEQLEQVRARLQQARQEKEALEEQLQALLAGFGMEG